MSSQVPRADVSDLTGDPSVESSAYQRSEALFDRTPPWIISTIVHTILLICLVLFHSPIANDGAYRLTVSLTAPESSSDPLETEPLDSVSLETQAVVESTETLEVTSAVIPPSEAVEVPSPLAPSPSEQVSEEAAENAANAEVSAMLANLASGSSSTALSRQLPTGGMYQRDAASRTDLGQRYGSTQESEDAVEAALQWLAAHQQPNGAWRFDLRQAPCNGQCRNPPNAESFSRPATAATGLALLAFLGAGYSQHEGKYQDQVRRGLYFLRDEARPSGSGFDLQGGSMYGHGIAMMAIGEAMAMSRYRSTGDRELFSLTQGGANFTAAAQHRQGGWRYVPGSPGDMTVTAWQVLSLISAQHGGVVLPSPTLPRAESFVRSLSKPSAYAFGYQGVAPEPTTTAVGLCTLLYLGQSPEEEAFAKSLDRLAKAGPKPNDVYHNYYATLALHHARHPQWEAWHVPVRERLIATQAKTGHEAGSWHFPDKNGDVGGRLYTTAMCAMILEVYYRYLPLYQKRDEFRLD